MKYLVLLAILVLAWVLFFKSRRGPSERPPGTPHDGSAGKPPARAKDTPPAAIIACAHCGLHLPQSEAQFDVAGRPYCGEAHRLAGPR